MAAAAPVAACGPSCAPPADEMRKCWGDGRPPQFMADGRRSRREGLLKLKVKETSVPMQIQCLSRYELSLGDVDILTLLYSTANESIGNP